MAESINTTIANGILRDQHYVAQFAKGVDSEIQRNLLVLQAELEREILSTDFGSRTDTQQRRLQSLKSDVDQLVNTNYRANAAELQTGLTALAPEVQRLAIQTINTAFTFDITQPTLTRLELRAFSRNPVVLGGTTTENWWKQREGLKQRFVEQMRLGIAQGETNSQLVQRVLGTTTGKRQTVTLKDGTKRRVGVRSGGVLDLSRSQATTLVRTSTQSVSNSTLDATYRENEDIIKGVQVLVTLDGRTSRICISLSGGAWNIRTGDALSTSSKQIPYPGPPPYHWQCRTVIAPITKSWAELSTRKRGQVLSGSASPSDVRASMTGTRADVQNYSAFLRQEGVNFQNRVLGPTRAKMFRAGTLQLDQLTDSMLRPLTLDQLKGVNG